MRKWVANSYVLSLSVLIAELVRQHQEDARRERDASATAAAATAVADDDGHDPAERSAVSKSSLNALALFLVDELQHPMQDADAHEDGARFTSLASLLRRLQRRVMDTDDFMILSTVLVGILSTVDSPDAVSNVVDRIAECVAAPASQTDDVGGDSTSSLLTRTSLLGLFVRKFLLAVNRLLFDGISHLYDDVVRYVEQFQQHEARAREAYGIDPGDVDDDDDGNVSHSDAASSDVLSDSASAAGDPEPRTQDDDSMEMDLEASPSLRQSGGFLWCGGGADDSLPLSPIPTCVSAMRTPEFQPIAHSSAASSPAAESGLADVVLDPVAVGEPRDIDTWSHDQMNFLLSDTMRAIERERVDDDPLAAQLAKVTQRDRSSPSVLFVKYLDYLHRRDYQGALDSLHQYHDIALLAAKHGARLDADTMNANGHGTGSSGSAALGARSGVMHFQGSGIQYAALNLAGLQIMFDHHEAALESIQETIRVAQHHGDHICVAFALTWLIRVYWSLGKPKEHVLALLESCMERAKELRVPSLQVLGALTHVESDLLRRSDSNRSCARLPERHTTHHLPAVYASQTPAPRPLHIWYRLQTAVQSVSAMASASGVGSGAASGGVGSGRGVHGNPLVTAAQQSSSAHQSEQSGSGVQWLKSIDGILESMWKLSGKLALSSAVSWQVFGHRTLATLFDRVHLLCFHDTASACEIALSVCNLVACGLGEENDADAEVANVYARGLSFLVDTIDSASATGDLIQCVPVQRKFHSLFFLWALRTGELTRATLHAELLLDLSPVHKDLQAHIEALLARAALWREAGHYTRSLELLEAVEAACDEHVLAFLRAQALVATAQTLQQATSAVAPLSALSAALRAVQVCKLQQYDLLLAEAHLVVAELYLAMGRIEDADSLVQQQMPFVMEHGDVNLRGESLLVLAKAALARGGGDNAQAHTCAVELLQQSTAMFAAVQHTRRLQEVAYLQAIVFNHLSTLSAAAGGSEFAKQRELAASAFVRFEKRLELARAKTVEPFVDLESADSIRQLVYHRMHEDA